MRELLYSKGALDTLQYFHRRRFVVYVEGKEDIPFWSALFHLAGVTDAYFKIAGGEKEVAKYAESIVVNGADIFVARDADFAELMNQQLDHPRVLYTYGYAIENSMCSIEAIGSLLRIHLYSNDDQTQVAAAWIAESEVTARRLVELDIAVRIEGSGVEVPAGNAMRFLDPRTAALSKPKIEQVTKPIEKKVSAAAITEAEIALKTCGKPLRSFFRGHFLVSAIMHYVCQQVRSKTGSKLSLSADALYGALVAHVGNCIPKSAEWSHYETQIVRMAADA